MIRNYFKIAWRNLIRNKFVSAINIGGLAVGLAVAFIIMAWVKDEVSYDKFHKELPKIFAVMQNIKQGGEVLTTQSVPGPLAEDLRSEVPEVQYAARVSYGAQQLISVDGKNIYENGIYAEPDYFQIMTFPSINGDPVAALKETNSIVITESTAKELFGKDDPINKIIKYNNQQTFKVGAVIKDIPSNSTYSFDVVLPFSAYEKDNSYGLSRWDNNFILTWIKLNSGTNIEGLNTKLTHIIQEKQSSEVGELFAYPLADIAMNGNFKNGKPSGGRIEMLIMMGGLALFVLLIACVNFMNLSTARGERRAREVGVRKSIGASRKNLIVQFLSEAFLVTLLALLIGFAIAELLLPGFNSLTGKNASLDVSNWKILTALLVTALVTGLFSGIYPAFYLSRFQPVKVLKGVITDSKGKSMLRKGLVTFQFVISTFLIIVTLVINKQVKYGQERTIGYNQQNLIEIPARGDMQDKFDLLRNKLLQIPNVESVSASSDNMVSYNGSSNTVQWPGKTSDQDFNFFITTVQYDWTKTTGIKILEGRDFSQEYASDTLACILNKAAVKKMQLKDPVIGTKVDNHMVIGVIDDFTYNDVFSSPSPMIAFLSKGSMSHFFVKLNGDVNWKQNLSAIEKAVKQTNPDYPFEYQLTEEVYDRKFTGIRSGVQFSSMVGVLAIIVSCLGLFALSVFIAERRTKEIGIRKVLGASVANIWLSLSKDFLKPVLLAFVIAAPIAALVMQKMLSSMEHHIGLSIWIFASAGAMVILLALLIVSFQGIKAAIANPVKSLRTE